MSIEQRIKRIEEAMKAVLDSRDWLASEAWAENRARDEDLGRHLDDAVEQHERTVEAYRNILSTLKAR